MEYHLPMGNRVDLTGEGLLYEQLMRRIVGDIAVGRLGHGQRLASERDLCERFAVSRNTLRRALTALADKGVLRAAGRHGWFIAETPVTETIDGPQSLSAWALSQGLDVTSRVCSAQMRAPTEEEAAALRIAKDSPIFELERVRLVNGSPLSLDRSRLVLESASSLADVDFTSASLYSAIRERAGIIPSRMETVVHAVNADARTARLLEISRGDAVLVLDELIFSQYDKPFEFARLSNRGDRYRFRTR